MMIIRMELVDHPAILTRAAAQVKSQAWLLPADVELQAREALKLLLQVPVPVGAVPHLHPVLMLRLCRANHTYE
jgi:hypothetical protein